MLRLALVRLLPLHLEQLALLISSILVLRGQRRLPDADLPLQLLLGLELLIVAHSLLVDWDGRRLLLPSLFLRGAGDEGLLLLRPFWLGLRADLLVVVLVR